MTRDKPDANKRDLVKLWRSAGGLWIDQRREAGFDGPDAARRYVAAHPGAVVTAWRATEEHGVFPYMLPIVEPGDDAR